MKYLKFETPSLTAMTAGLEGKDVWEKIGSNTNLIKMNTKSKGEAENDVIKYYLPVSDENQARKFAKYSKNTFNIDVTIEEE